MFLDALSYSTRFLVDFLQNHRTVPILSMPCLQFVELYQYYKYYQYLGDYGKQIKAQLHSLPNIGNIGNIGTVLHFGDIA